MNKVIFPFVFLLCAFAFSSQAKECDESTMSAVEWRECIEGQNENAMNTAYNRLIKSLSGQTNAIEAIKEAQENWIKFRDSTCYYISETASREDGAVCVDEFNENRVKTLDRYAKDARGR